MAFIITEGCCGLTLQHSCLIIGTVYLVLNILSCCVNFIFGLHPMFLVESVLFISFSLCLILATAESEKDLCIPWFVGFTITCAMFVVLICSLIGSFIRFNLSNSAHKKIHKDNLLIVLCILAFFMIKFAIEIIMFRYVLSYYKQLSD